MDFCLCVHHEGAIARDWFIQRRTSDKQDFQRGFLVCRIFDSHFAAVGSEQHHLSVSAALTFRSKKPCSLNDVSEGVVIARHLLRRHSARLEPVMQVNNRRTCLNIDLTSFKPMLFPNHAAFFWLCSKR